MLALVGLPVVGALLTLVVVAYLTSWDLVTEDVGAVLFALVFCGWALLPFAAAVVVGVCVHRFWPGAVAVALAGAVVLVAVTVWVLWSVLSSQSSTAVLALLFAPFVQAAVAGLTMAAAVAVAKLRRRGAPRSA
ncbi:hypothetical protein [Kineococcus gypseus]|uniref:hypothetical protein n=1 Tax=Kineococcus gypseus TaxID=1637102 RepID=UPI003D7E6C0F